MAPVYLPLDQWPACDRAAWAIATRPGDILDGWGEAAHWRPETQRINGHHYAHWLGYLAAIGDLDPDANPEDRVTPDRVRRFITQLEGRVAPRTVVSTLVGLKVTIKAMAPEISWSWLGDACNALNRTAQPIKNKRSRMKDTGEIVAAATSELDRLAHGPLTSRLDRVAFRNGLMLAFMAARPLRLGNFTGLTLGRHLVGLPQRWDIYIPGEETKTGQPLHFTVPKFLTPYIETYLERVRPTFIRGARPAPSAVWLTYQGGPLARHSVYMAFIRITKKLFGHTINPHLLRDCAATTLSTRSMDDALTAAALLGHRNFSTTERHYIRANQLDASRQITRVIETIRVGSREES